MIDELHTIDTLEGLKALASPVRIQLVRALIESEGTAKELAEHADLKVTAVYRHLKAMQAAGIVVVAREAKIAGQQTTWYRARAKVLRLSPGLLDSLDPTDRLEADRQLAASALEVALADVHRASVPEEAPYVSHVHFMMTDDDRRFLEAGWNKLLDDLEARAATAKAHHDPESLTKVRITAVVQPGFLSD